MSKLVYSVSQSLKIFNYHSKTDVFWFANVSIYKGILFKHEQKIEHVIHIFIVKFMQENYLSGDFTFWLFDFRRQWYNSKCITMILGPF